MNKNDLRFEFMRGQGPGGTNKNKLETACRVTHIPTGLTGYADERKQQQSKKEALKTLETRLKDVVARERAAIRKARRDDAIHNMPRVRTYNYQRGMVTDHRTGKKAPLKKVMNGRLDLLR